MDTLYYKGEYINHINLIIMYTVLTTLVGIH
jgi:hypothetical protein